MSADADHPPEPQQSGGSGAETRGRTDWRARRRIDEVFGSDLPDVTADECEQGHKGVTRDWYEANRPPHYE
ncbi:hypothetical protein GIY30_15995 [Gordonia sp. HNM0687]|uniref:Uncharacterized protein n=1 Tax=Gordonia mangrovi TaxID=2665643 RepID=A0A6L7GS90_9ACTN|nr:hypothetical protein [Gordonia mangrovi]MXP22844.1 hypothetical protein [Gordonia mangrovi]UVF77152.1 hypothetical protein NWF22_17795 [Gordonia mangrovi]